MRIVPKIVSVVLVSLSSFSVAQSDAHNHEPKAPEAAKAAAAPKAPAAKSEAQKGFDTLKTLAGEWEGPVETDFPMAIKKEEIKPLHVTMRVTSRGNVLVHEFQEAGTPLDPTKFDHPVTTLYVDADRLNLVHYCDAGNRPHMTAKISPDGKRLEFDIADLSGSNKFGHMYHAIFTIVDENHHMEEWSYMLPGDKPVYARFNLTRVNVAGD